MPLRFISRIFVIPLLNIITTSVSTLSSEGCTEKYYSVNNTTGTFTSRGYPRSYPVDITCHYVFQGKGRERVQITFTDLDLGLSSDDDGLSVTHNSCDDMDTVTVSVSVEGVSQDIGHYCGSKRPPMLMSHDSQMNVTFIARNPTYGRGFKANFSFVTDFGIKSGEHEKDLVCGFTFRSNKTTNGTFTSPNFPGLYPRNTECHYLFYGAPNECIYITFPYFDVDGVQPGCLESTSSDYVEFSNFNVDLMDRKMSRFCGTKDDEQAKKSVSSDGNFFRVTFKSNNVYDASGFEAFYQFRKVEDPYSSRNSRKLSNGIRPIQPMQTIVSVCLLLLYSVALQTDQR